MPHCQNFKQKIEELKRKAQNIEALLLEYKKTGDEKTAKQFEDELEKTKKEIEAEIEEFKNKEFMPKVKKLLSKWYPKKDNLNEFLQNIKINERGRVEIEVLDLFECNLTGTLYIPFLFEKIEKLDCSANKLESLPELSNGLKSLWCYINELTSLPKLPDGLKEFRCFFNQLKSLPELPDGLELLWCANNQLKSLPELPDGLERLYCPNNNQLTSLPELPKTLKDLDCSGCPLSDEAIQKIKSHPNYNSNWKI